MPLVTREMRPASEGRRAREGEDADEDEDVEGIEELTRRGPQEEPAAAAMDVAERRQATADMMIWLARERLSSLVENGLREKDRKREN